MYKYNQAIFIGRFQPFHNSHLYVCKEALKLAPHLIILIGSSNSSRNLRNPFTFQERKTMISEALNEEGYAGQYTILGIRDFYYSDNMWVAHVQNLISSCVGSTDSTCLVGLNKDESTYYLSLFPRFTYEEVKQETLIHATNIRDQYLSQFPEVEFEYKSCLPASTQKFLLSFAEVEEYYNLKYEFETIRNYKNMYRDAQKICGIFPPVFVTVDAIVTCGGHILLVTRKFHPGKGLRALPGGFIGQTELIQDACIRELREETRIKIPPAVLRGSIIDSHVFDYPNRSSRGRTITHAFHINLKETELPKVKGSDDADKAGWFPLNTVMNYPETFFEDHFHIIEYFINRG